VRLAEAHTDAGLGSFGHALAERRGPAGSAPVLAGHRSLQRAGLGHAAHSHLTGGQPRPPPGCPAIGSLPRPRPAPHLGVWIKAGVTKSGHRSVSVKLRGRIPAGDTMILAFSSGPGRDSLGAGSIITGPVPRCVSLPPAPSGGGGAGSTSS
jgi:hypothetical protein